MIRFLSRHLICVFTIACLIVYGMVYLGGAFPEPIRSDGIGYYAYLPAILIHGDPSFETLANLKFGGEMPRWAGFGRSSRTGRYVDKYGVGTALLLTPFFVGAHILTYAFRSPADWHRFNFAADGFTFFYQHAVGLGAMAYGLLGIVLLRKALERWFSDEIVLLTLLALFAGTNLFHYFSGETVLSHPFSFFLFGVVLVLAPKLMDKDMSWRDVFLFGAALGLLLDVRVTNALVLVPLAIRYLFAGDSLRDRIATVKNHWPRILVIFSVTFLVFFPQLFMWRYSSGRWLTNAYDEALQEHFEWAHPQFLNVLFSLRGGVLFWSPVLIIAVFGFIPLRRYNPPMFWSCAVFIVLFTWLVASWHDWAFGGGFGHRGFVEAYAFLAFPMAAFYQRISESPRRWLKWSVGILSALLICYSLFFQMLYYTRELSIYGLDRQALFDILWWRKQRLEAWWRMMFP